MSDVNLMAEKVEECSHTAGPWTLNADAHRHEPGFYGTPNEPGEKEVYTAIRIGESGVRLTGYILPADANLIVAAPELLAALKELLASSLAPYPPYEEGKIAQDAWSDRKAKARNDAAFLIAKAEGRS